MGSAQVSYPDPTPSVSVVVCTRNRAARLHAMLAAFDGLDVTGVRAFEIVIVDNGSTDGTRAVVADWIARTPLSARLLSEARTGLCRAKNTAIQVSAGDLILCTDDDCAPASDWVQGFLRAFNGNLMQLIGGRVELGDETDARITVKTDTVPDRLASANALLGFVHGCNMAFGRGVVDRIERFDVRLGPGSKCFAAEDTDFVYRAFRAGLPVRYEPGPVVYHNHGRSRAQDHYGLIAKYNFGFGAMVMKHALRGRTDLIRPLYWSMHSIVRHWWTGAYPTAMGRTVPRFAAGAFHFLVRQSWRRADI